MKKNAPYVKKYVNGILENPITKESPYLNFPNINFKKIFERNRNGNRRFWEQTKNSFFLGRTITKY
jgi:hypothetical protein